MLIALATSLLSLPLLSTAPAAQDPVMPPDKGEVVTTASGLKYSVLEAAEGPRPQAGDLVRVHYSGWLTDGKLFDSSRRGEPFQFKLGSGGVIAGWDEGVALMPKGSRFRFTIPPELGYGERGSPPVIPGNATLVFDVELLGFVTPPRFRPADPAAQVTLPSGLVYEVIEPGQGEPPAAGKLCEVEFALFNTSGKLIDASVLQQRNFREICGQSRLAFLNEVLPLMKPGARLRLEVPPALTPFAGRPMGPDLPANSLTVWEIALANVIEPLPLPGFAPLDPQSKVTTASGLSYQVIQPGTGKSPVMGQDVTVHYAGWLTNGTLFDASYQRAEPATFQLGRVINGWNEGLQLMKEGGIYRFEIPPTLAYGKRGSPPTIPADATLIFHVELLQVGG